MLWIVRNFYFRNLLRMLQRINFNLIIDFHTILKHLFNKRNIIIRRGQIFDYLFITLKIRILVKTINFTLSAFGVKICFMYISVLFPQIVCVCSNNHLESKRMSNRQESLVYINLIFRTSWSALQIKILAKEFFTPKNKINDMIVCGDAARLIPISLCMNQF